MMDLLGGGLSAASLRARALSTQAAFAGLYIATTLQCVTYGVVHFYHHVAASELAGSSTQGTRVPCEAFFISVNTNSRGSTSSHRVLVTADSPCLKLPARSACEIVQQRAFLWQHDGCAAGT